MVEKDLEWNVPYDSLTTAYATQILGAQDHALDKLVVSPPALAKGADPDMEAIRAAKEQTAINQRPLLDKYKRLEVRARAYVIKCLSNKVLEALRPMDEGTCESLWSALMNIRSSNSTFSQREVLTRVSTTTMSSSESLLTYLGNMEALYDRLIGTDSALSDVLKCMWTKKGVPPAYEQICSLLDLASQNKTYPQMRLQLFIIAEKKIEDPTKPADQHQARMQIV